MKALKEYRIRNHVILWIVALLIIALRVPNCWRGGEFIGEDAWVFFAEAFNSPWNTSILTPYAGYFHLAPRLVAEVFSILPIVWQPYAYGVFSLVLAASVFSLFYLKHFESLIRDSWIRAGVVILLALAGNAENLGLLLGTHWYLSFAMALLLVINPPQGKAGRIAMYVLAFLTIWSTPVVAVLFPFLVFRCWRGDSRFIRRWALFCTLNLIVVGLFVVWMRLDMNARTGEYNFLELAIAIERLVIRGWLGKGLLGEWLTLRVLDINVGILYLWGTFWLAMFTWVGWRHWKHPAIKRIYALLAIALLMILMSLTRSLYIADMGSEALPRHARYLTAPTSLLLVAVWGLISHFRCRKQILTVAVVWVFQLMLLVWSCPTMEHPSFWPGRGKSRLFHIRNYVPVIETFEARYRKTGIPSTLYIPYGVLYWGPVLKWGGGAAECLPPMSMAECLGLMTDADGYCDSWLGRFRQFRDSPIVEHEKLGRLEFRGVSQGRVWFRDADDKLIITSPLLYPIFCVMEGMDSTYVSVE